MFRKLCLFIALAIGFVGSAATQVSAQIDMNGGNSKVDRRIRSEILTLPYYGVFDVIGYQTDGGTVTLTGYVVRPTTKEAAEDSVKEIDGVTNVVNNIEVLPLSSADDRIRRRTLQALTKGGGTLMYYFLGTNPSIRIIVKDGRIILEGYVDSKADSDLANVRARGVSGTFGVTNNLKVMGDIN